MPTARLAFVAIVIACIAPTAATARVFGEVVQTPDDELKAKLFGSNEIELLTPPLPDFAGEPMLTCVSESLRTDGTGRKGVKSEFSGTVEEVDANGNAIRQMAVPLQTAKTRSGGFARVAWDNGQLANFLLRGRRYRFRMRSRPRGNRRMVKYRTRCGVSSFKPCTAGPSTFCHGNGQYSSQVFYQLPGSQNFNLAEVLNRSSTGATWGFGSNRIEMQTEVLNGCRSAERAWSYTQTRISPWTTRTVITHLPTGWMWTVYNRDYKRGTWRRSFRRGCR